MILEEHEKLILLMCICVAQSLVNIKMYIRNYVSKQQNETKKYCRLLGSQERNRNYYFQIPHQITGESTPIFILFKYLLLKYWNV